MAHRGVWVTHFGQPETNGPLRSSGRSHVQTTKATSHKCFRLRALNGSSLSTDKERFRTRDRLKLYQACQRALNVLQYTPRYLLPCSPTVCADVFFIISRHTSPSVAGLSSKNMALWWRKGRMQMAMKCSSRSWAGTPGCRYVVIFVAGYNLFG